MHRYETVQDTAYANEEANYEAMGPGASLTFGATPKPGSAEYAEVISGDVRTPSFLGVDFTLVEWRIAFQ